MSEKRIKIPGRFESGATGNVVAGADAIKDDTRGKMQVVVNNELEAAILALGEGKQNKMTFDNTPTEDSTNPVTSGGVYAADKLLSDAIEAILLLIPSAASALNKLVDLATMNSSIATATASFKGTYNLVSDLHLGVDATHAQIAATLDALSLDADNNDYAFVQVPNTDTAPTEIAKTERYKFNGTNWAYEYDLNNSGFTSAQWNAINSGITTLLVSKLSALPTNSELVQALAAKQDNLTFDNAPAAGSNNPVKSSGIYTRNNEIVALINTIDAAKQDVLTFDTTPTSGSPNPVTSNGIYLAIQLVQTAVVALDGRMSTAETKISTAETNIVNLQAAYSALTQSDIVVVEGALPSTGQQQNIIYRQPDPDHTPPQFYSDYMWNGTAWVLMAQYDNAIDDEPDYESNNLAKSGGIFKQLAILPKFTSRRFIAADGTLRSANSDIYTATVDYYPVVAGMTYKTNIRCAVDTNMVIAFYDENKTLVSYTNTNGNPITVPSGAKFARFSDLNNISTRAYVYIKPELNDSREVDVFICSLIYAAISDYKTADNAILDKFFITEQVPLIYNKAIDGYGNVFNALANYARTDYVAVTEGMYIKNTYLSGTPPYCFHAFYDGNYNFISSVQDTYLSIAPTGARFVRFSGYIYDTSTQNITVTKTVQNISSLLQQIYGGLSDAIKGGLKDSIVCWGDSLTQGAGSDMTHNLATVLSFISGKGLNVSQLSDGCNYPQALSKFIGKKTYEFGVGGENLKAIACRASANLIYNSEEITIPAGGSAVFNKNILKYSWDDTAVDFAWQHGSAAYSPCYVNGVKCVLDKQDDTYLTLSLVNASASSFVIKANTPIMLKGVEYKNPNWVIIWAGTNGGYTSMDDYIEKIDKMLKVINPKHYIIMHRYAWNSNQAESCEAQAKFLRAYYGSAFFDVQYYLTHYALTDFGITPTTDADLTQEQLDNGVISDVNCMAAGILPSSLWRRCYGVDGVTTNDLHLNAAGYAIIAYKIQEIIKITEG